MTDSCFLSDIHLANQTLTSAVGEPPVARGTHGAVSADHVGPAAALATERLAGVALGSDLVAGAGHRPVVEEGRQRHRRAEAERRGGGGTGGAREEEESFSHILQKHVDVNIFTIFDNK